MNENEKAAGEILAEKLAELPESKREYILGYAEGMKYAKAAAETDKKEAEDDGKAS